MAQTTQTKAKNQSHPTSKALKHLPYSHSLISQHLTMISFLSTPTLPSVAELPFKFILGRTLTCFFGGHSSRIGLFTMMPR